MNPIYIKNHKYLRHKAKLSQEGLAQRLNKSRPAIGAIEEGRTQPSIDMLFRMAELFNVSVEDLWSKDLTQVSLPKRKRYTQAQIDNALITVLGKGLLTDRIKELLCVH